MSAAAATLFAGLAALGVLLGVLLQKAGASAGEVFCF
jgi:hypothetical protein